MSILCLLVILIVSFVKYVEEPLENSADESLSKEAASFSSSPSSITKNTSIESSGDDYHVVK